MEDKISEEQTAAAWKWLAMERQSDRQWWDKRLEESHHYERMLFVATITSFVIAIICMVVATLAMAALR